MRRVACAAACATLLLLAGLLQRTPPSPRPPVPRPAPLPVSGPAHSAPSTNHSRAHSTSAHVVVTNTNHNATASKNVSSTPRPAHPAPPGVVLTRDLYEAGHWQPHPELCAGLGARVTLLVLVTSAPAHRSQRDAIRLTWGHARQRADVALGFVLGSSPSAPSPAGLQQALAEEDALYGDVVVGRSVDSYSNLTLKSLSLLEWTHTYCPRAAFLLKTDDDMFINIPRLLAFIQHPARRTATRTLWGKVLKKAYPKRTPHAKYYLSPKQYPGKVLPDFATGPAYLLTADCIPPLLRAAPAMPYVRLEDVFVTGVLAAKVGIRRVSAAEFVNRRVSPHACAVQRAVALHMVKYHEQFDLWRKLLDGKTKCT